MKAYGIELREFFEKALEEFEDQMHLENFIDIIANEPIHVRNQDDLTTLVRYFYEKSEREINERKQQIQLTIQRLENLKTKKYNSMRKHFPSLNNLSNDEISIYIELYK